MKLFSTMLLFVGMVAPSPVKNKAPLPYTILSSIISSVTGVDLIISNMTGGTDDLVTRIFDTSHSTFLIVCLGFNDQQY